MGILHGTAHADLVPCGQALNNPCQLSDLSTLAFNIFNFLVFSVAVPLAALAITIGGALVILQGINANFLATGKNLIWSAVIGILIIFASWLIIHEIARLLGLPGA